jgi:hypothetical protein
MWVVHKWQASVMTDIVHHASVMTDIIHKWQASDMTDVKKNEVADYSGL